MLWFPSPLRERGLTILVCRSDISLLTIEKQAPWFQEKYTLVWLFPVDGISRVPLLTSRSDQGHEGCGQIIQFGADVGETSLKLVGSTSSLGTGTSLILRKGDTVALHAVPGCRTLSCSECSRGLPQICESGHHSGIGQDGFHAPYATIDIKGAVLVPQSEYASS